MTRFGLVSGELLPLGQKISFRTPLSRTFKIYGWVPADPRRPLSGRRARFWDRPPRSAAAMKKLVDWTPRSAG